MPNSPYGALPASPRLPSSTPSFAPPNPYIRAHAHLPSCHSSHSSHPDDPSQAFPPSARDAPFSRWQALLAAPLQSLERAVISRGWVGRRRGGVMGRAAGRAVEFATRSLSALWVVDEQEEHAHGDEDMAGAGSGDSVLDRQGKALRVSRVAYGVVLLLLLLGLREVLVLSTTEHARDVKIRRRDPFQVLEDFAPKQKVASALAGQGRYWRSELGTNERYLDEEQGDITAVVLHWKRTENVVVIVAQLCQYSFFNSVFIWNNNPEIQLSREMFKDAKCPPSKLRIYNSPNNMLFFARYLACASSSTPNCFFQDDDWLVQPLRALYAQFRRDPEGPIVVHTNPEVATLFSSEWCFFQHNLHTCFAWVGTGAFVARIHVQRFLATASVAGYGLDELSHADNSFSLFQNEPPYVLSSRLSPLPQPYGHSDGAGIARNKEFIQRGIVHVTDFLGPAPADEIQTLVQTPLLVNITAYRTPRAPPLPPHPYAHHTRSPCADDSCLFLTNVALLPPPDAVPYPGPARVTLEEWENYRGWYARGWMEGGEMFAEEETWAIRWPYSAAVDGDLKTAFRSLDVVQAGDYIAMGLLAPIDSQWTPRLTLNFVLEKIESILPGLILQVSSDGYHWRSPLPDSSGRPPFPTCHLTPHTSQLPDLSFPSTYLSSPAALETRQAETIAGGWFLGRWWRRRKLRAKTLVECRVVLGTKMKEASEDGWQFVRLLHEDGTTKAGWGVYEMWIGPA